MKPVLILQHQVPENAAYLTTWLEQHNVDYVVVNAGAGQEFPATIEPYAALAVMGGGMSANDALMSNRQAEILILQAMLKDRPVIGHCLGGQLMARALGGTVTVASVPEIGWQSIEYSDHPLAATWFGNDPTRTVIHWHYDTFSIPPGAELLASSAVCPNQAFAFGKHLAMQFHIEIDQTKIDSWTAEDDPKWQSARDLHKSAQSRDAIVNGIDLYLDKHQLTADRIYSHWLSTTEWVDHINK
jgi:GMP synthase-like glutamine amidotransferase